jgi:hypothetical protein
MLSPGLYINWGRDRLPENLGTGLSVRTNSAGVLTVLNSDGAVKLLVAPGHWISTWIAEEKKESR